MAAFIVSQRARHGVPYAVSLRALGVSQSWFYKWKDGDRSARRKRRNRLKAEIARLFAARKGKDGSPRITAALRDAGWAVSENTVGHLMAEMGLAARRKRGAGPRPGRARADGGRRTWSSGRSPRPGSTRSGTATAPISPRRGQAAPGQWVLDMGSRRILGFGLSEHPDAELAYGALAMAVAVRGWARCPA